MSGLASACLVGNKKADLDVSKEVISNVVEMISTALPYIRAESRNGKSAQEMERNSLAAVFERVAPELEKLGEKYKQASLEEEKAAGRDPNKIDI